MRLSKEQHNHLFMTEVDVWPESEEAGGDDTSSMASEGPFTPILPTPPGGSGDDTSETFFANPDVLNSDPIGVDASSSSGSAKSAVQPMKTSE